MANPLTDYRIFAKEFFRTFHTTGAILPSSPRLARALTRFVANHDALPSGGRAILEVGPGTGAVTRFLVRRMAADDRLTMVELNERFVARLRELVARDPLFVPAAARIDIVHDRLQALPQEGQFDLIVSGLPLNNFAAADVEEILGAMRGLLRPGGTLSFFEYVAVRPVRSALGRRAEKERVRAISQLLNSMFREHRVARDGVWTNVPPAWAHHVQFTPA